MGLWPAKPDEKRSRVAQTCRRVACLRLFESAHTSRPRTAGRMRHPWFFRPCASPPPKARRGRAYPTPIMQARSSLGTASRSPSILEKPLCFQSGGAFSRRKVSSFWIAISLISRVCNKSLSSFPRFLILFADWEGLPYRDRASPLHLGTASCPPAILEKTARAEVATYQLG